MNLMDRLPILQQKPHTREIPSKQSQQKNDILSNIATNTIEFLEDITKGPIDDKIFFKNNRIFYIGIIFLVVALLLFLSNKN
jgi:hypothetical protein